MRNAWHVARLLFPLVLLGGCALPPAMVVASYSADIVSYAATGKTVTDHAYSVVARSDCSFMRVLHDKPICVDEPSAPPEGHVAQANDVAKPAAIEPTRNAYVQIGSFLDPANAERARARYARYHAVVMAAVVHGRRFHRVVAGPLTAAETTRLKQKMIVIASHANHSRG